MKEIQTQGGISLQDLIVYNIKQTIEAFNDINNSHFKCDVTISDKRDEYFDGMGFGNRVAPKRKHTLEITLTEGY